MSHCARARRHRAVPPKRCCSSTMAAQPVDSAILDQRRRYRRRRRRYRQPVRRSPARASPVTHGGSAATTFTSVPSGRNQLSQRPADAAGDAARPDLRGLRAYSGPCVPLPTAAHAGRNDTTVLPLLPTSPCTTSWARRARIEPIADAAVAGRAKGSVAIAPTPSSLSGSS